MSTTPLTPRERIDMILTNPEQPGTGRTTLPLYWDQYEDVVTEEEARRLAVIYVDHIEAWESHPAVVRRFVCGGVTERDNPASPIGRGRGLVFARHAVAEVHRRYPVEPVAT